MCYIVSNYLVVKFSASYCEFILFHGHKLSWFDDDGHLRGHLNLLIFKLNAQLLN